MSTLSKEEKIKLMKEAVERINSLPNSEKHNVSQELLDRMQSEAEAGYVEITEEQKQRWRKQLLTDE